MLWEKKEGEDDIQPGGGEIRPHLHRYLKFSNKNNPDKAYKKPKRHAAFANLIYPRDMLLLPTSSSCHVTEKENP